MFFFYSFKCVWFWLFWLITYAILSFFVDLVYIIIGPSKTDSAPVRGNGYKPGSSKFRLRANAETSHSVRYDMVVVVASIVGGSKKFSHGIVRSRKPPPLIPLTITTTTLSSY